MKLEITVKKVDDGPPGCLSMMIWLGIAVLLISLIIAIAEKT